MGRIDAKRREGRQDDEEDGVGVQEGEGQVDEEDVAPAAVGDVFGVEVPVNVRDDQGDQEGEDKGYDEVRPVERLSGGWT